MALGSNIEKRLFFVLKNIEMSDIYNIYGYDPPRLVHFSKMSLPFN